MHMVNSTSSYLKQVWEFLWESKNETNFLEESQTSGLIDIHVVILFGSSDHDRRQRFRSHITPGRQGPALHVLDQNDVVGVE